MDDKKRTILECKGITKKFPGVLALDKVDFDCYRGEIHGLLGENGAGKTTLMKIIAGAYTMDSGKIFLDGKEVKFKSTDEALGSKIVTVFQEGNVIESQTVVENIFLNHELKIQHTPFVDGKKMSKVADELIEHYDLEVKSQEKVKGLTVDEKKMVEVFRGITQGARVLILDEPTSSLKSLEKEKLLKFLKDLARRNIGIIFITHNVNEALETCNRITVLREGVKIKTSLTKDVSEEEIIDFMLGKKIRRKPIVRKNVVRNRKNISVEGLNIKGKLHNINLYVNEGEIVGITGLIGSGGTDLANAIFGVDNIKKDSGKIVLRGKEIKIKNPSDAIKSGIAYLTRDKRSDGLFLRFPVFENITITSLRKFINKIGLIKKGEQVSTGEKYKNLLDIKTPSIFTLAENLSGGNQQKVVVSKWLETSPVVMIMDEPTMGIDVGAKVEIRRIINDITSMGKSVILVSYEPDDIVGLCDRIVVMYKGKIVKEIEGKKVTRKMIMSYATKGYD